MSKRAKPAPEVVESIKGFDANWRCRDFQYAVGQTYKMEGPVILCERGFHAVADHPLAVFRYRPPAGSRYADVLQGGAISRRDDDGKLASTEITIKAEISLGELIQRAVKWVFDHSKPADGAHTDKNQRAASATGAGGAASATGTDGAASATGTHGAAMSIGFNGRVMGADGCALFLVRRNDIGSISHAWAGIAGRDNIKPMVWYQLDEAGYPQEVVP